MHEITALQLAADYCCTPEAVRDGQNHFSIYYPHENRRRFDGEETCFLKVACVNGKILFAGREDILEQVKAEFASANGAWFMEAENLRKLNVILQSFGYRIRQMHPFYISGEKTAIAPTEYEIRWYRGEEINQFAGDARFDAAYAFCREAPDVLGVAACQNGEILGMAGASADSPLMWQIGINTMPQARGRGIAPLLATLLKNAVLEEGKLPYYGTAFSHIASQRTALRSGFLPEWTELITEKL